MKNILILIVFLFSPSATAAEAVFETVKGTFVLNIDEEKAPVTAQNFIQYVQDGFFDDLIFHRVIPGFVIQGGGFTSDMQPRQTRPPIVNEAATSGLKNIKYSISMARTNDPNSATSQFFININNNGVLDYDKNPPGYAVFGQITKGQEVIDAIAAVPTGNHGPYQDVPLKPVVINKASLRP